MFDIDLCIEKAVDCLRRSGAFVHSEPRQEMVPVITPKAYLDEYYHLEPYWQWQDVEGSTEVIVTHPDFICLEKLLSGTARMKMLEKLEGMIPDSSDSVIVEVGSGYGDKWGGLLAKSKPNAQIILLDNGTGPAWDFSPDYLFNDINPEFRRVIFSQSIWPMAQENDIGLRVNGLYRMAGIPNLKFHQYALSKEDIDGGKLPSFLTDLKGKDIYIMANRAPRELPFLVGQLCDSLDANYMYVSLTAQEGIPENSFIWEIVEKNLGLTSKELKSFKHYLLDPNSKCCSSDKYDYKDSSQRMNGRTLKLAMALALAKEVQGEVLRQYTGKEYVFSYNQIDHFVEAIRK